MNNVILALSLIFLVSACSSMKNHKSCDTVLECVNLTSSLTGKKYQYIEKMGEKIADTGNITWTKENAEFLLGEILSQAGYYAQPIPGTDVSQIINGRDIRYHGNVPSYTASFDQGDNLPAANAGVSAELVYQVKNAPLASDMARNLRPFMSRYGRVIDVPASNIVIVRDNISTLHAVLALLRKMDVKLSKEQMAEMKRRRDQRPKPMPAQSIPQGSN